jgi:hypothetical protein
MNVIEFVISILEDTVLISEVYFESFAQSFKLQLSLYSRGLFMFHVCSEKVKRYSHVSIQSKSHISSQSKIKCVKMGRVLS